MGVSRHPSFSFMDNQVHLEVKMTKIELAATLLLGLVFFMLFCGWPCADHGAHFGYFYKLALVAKEVM